MSEMDYRAGWLEGAGGMGTISAHKSDAYIDGWVDGKKALSRAVMAYKSGPERPALKLGKMTDADARELTVTHDPSLDARNAERAVKLDGLAKGTIDEMEEFVEENIGGGARAPAENVQRWVDALRASLKGQPEDGQGLTMRKLGERVADDVEEKLVNSSRAVTELTSNPPITCDKHGVVESAHLDPTTLICPKCLNEGMGRAMGRQVTIEGDGQ